MPRKRSELQVAAGKLILAIQKEWRKESGESTSGFSENVMYAAHDFLQAGTLDGIRKLLGPMSVQQYLGEVWVQRHPNVKPAIAVIEGLINRNSEDNTPEDRQGVGSKEKE
jgi:hypothetical protein